MFIRAKQVFLISRVASVPIKIGTLKTAVQNELYCSSPYLGPVLEVVKVDHVDEWTHCCSEVCSYWI